MKRNKSLLQIVDDALAGERVVELEKIPDAENFLALIRKMRVSTGKIIIIPSRCTACWECVDVCPENVLVRTGFLFHKHILIGNSDACTGCLKCFHACNHKTIFRINRKTNINSI